MKLNKKNLISSFGRYTALSFDEIESMLSFLPEEFMVEHEKSPRIKPIKSSKEVINKINELIDAYNNL